VNELKNGHASGQVLIINEGQEKVEHLIDKLKIEFVKLFQVQFHSFKSSSSAVHFLVNFVKVILRLFFISDFNFWLINEKLNIDLPNKDEEERALIEQAVHDASKVLEKFNNS